LEYRKLQHEETVVLRKFRRPDSPDSGGQSDPANAFKFAAVNAARSRLKRWLGLNKMDDAQEIIIRDRTEEEITRMHEANDDDIDNVEGDAPLSGLQMQLSSCRVRAVISNVIGVH
jgi:hypothetical protein